MVQEDIRSALESMGFTPEQVEIGSQFSILENAIEYIMTKSPEGSSVPEVVQTCAPNPEERSSQGGHVTFSGDDDLEKAIQESILMEVKKSSGPNANAFDIINPFERSRDGAMPVGLKNVGNTCYVNSMLQSYFTIPQFRDEILSLPYFEELKENDPRTLSHELQKLFSFLILSERKYVDPSPVIQNIADKEGKQLHVGHQEDPTEFSILFFERLKESIVAIKKQESEVKTEDKNDGNDETKLAQQENSHNDDDNNNNNRNKEEGGDDDKDDKSMNEEKKNEEKENIPFLQNLFSTYTNQKVYAEEDDGEKIELSQKEEFTHIILDISYNDIYSSLDEYTSPSKIDEFTTPKGHKSSAEKLVFFTSLSKVLTFQLQRVDYDAKKNSAVKKHSKFEFPKELFMDRYMESNFEQTIKKRSEIQRLKQKKSHYEEKLNKYLNYNNTNYSIDVFLEQTIHYLNNNEKNVKNVPISFLVSQKEKILDEMEKLKQKIAEIQLLIDSIYDDMNSLSYKLHAVLVHDGEAGSGHYWAFLYHTGKKVWYKFNDITVSQVDEETVWKDSFGGHLSASAYCIIYLHTSISEESGLDNQIEYSLIPLQLQALIAEDNYQFQVEKTNWEENKHKIMAETENSRAIVPFHSSESGSNHSSSSSMIENDNALHFSFDITSEVLEKFSKLYSEKLDECILSNQQSQKYNPQLQTFANFLISTNHHELMQFEITNQVFQQMFGRNLTKVQAPSQLIAGLPNIPFRSSRGTYNVLLQIYESCRENLELLVLAFHSHLFDDNIAAIKRYIKSLQRDLSLPYPISRRDQEISYYLEKVVEALSTEAFCCSEESEIVNKVAFVAAGSSVIPHRYSPTIKERMKTLWLPLIERFNKSDNTETQKYLGVITSIFIHNADPNFDEDPFESIPVDEVWGQYVILKDQLDAKLDTNKLQKFVPSPTN